VIYLNELNLSCLRSKQQKYLISLYTSIDILVLLSHNCGLWKNSLTSFIMLSPFSAINLSHLRGIYNFCWNQLRYKSNKYKTHSILYKFVFTSGIMQPILVMEYQLLILILQKRGMEHLIIVFLAWEVLAQIIFAKQFKQL
jgi:hypothetical protein